MFDIEPHKHEIAGLCRRLGIRRLEIFGSAVTNDFTLASDIDCLIEFEEKGGSYFQRYFDLKYGSEKLFGRKVDVVVDSAIRNPYFREAVNHSRQLIYGA